MRTSRTICVAAIALAVVVVGSGAGIAAPSASDAYRIVIPQRAVRAGEHVPLRIEPPAPAGARINWSVMDLNEGLLAGIYRAPLIIPPGTHPVSVIASITIPSEQRTFLATTQIDLVPGAVVDAEYCLGPGQQLSTEVADILPTPTTGYLLTQLVVRSGPDYPKSDLARGIAQTIVVRALLCRSGHVIDAYPVPTFRDPPDQPIEFDPKLVEAAQVAVRGHVFTSPILPQGIAVWADIPVKFEP